jgi:hypothetical protein
MRARRGLLHPIDNTVRKYSQTGCQKAGTLECIESVVARHAVPFAPSRMRSWHDASTSTRVLQGDSRRRIVRACEGTACRAPTV